MSEEENNNSEQESTKKALKTGAKVAANTYAGPIGGKAVDLASKTKVGNEILNRGSNFVNRNMPGVANAAKAADDSGLTDTVDKLSDGGLSSNNAAGGLSKNDNKNSGPFDSDVDSDDEETNENISFKIPRRIKWALIGILGSFSLLLIIIVGVIAIIYSVPDNVNKLFNSSVSFFSNIGSSIIDFFTKDQQELEEEFYKKLESTQRERYNSENVCIDVNLLTATLTVNSSFDEVLENFEEGETNEYSSKMIKQIGLLANMQITHQKFSLDKNYKNSSGSYCRQAEEIVPVDSNNQSSFDRGILNFDWITEGTNLDSSSKMVIASHDKTDFSKFFTKKADEEKNYAYYLYYPAFNSDGTCGDDYAKEMLNNKNSNERAEISINDLSNMTDSVYYWNLVNSFIPEYYSDYLPNEEPSRTEAINKIAEDIYLLYQDIGPSQVCNRSSVVGYDCDYGFDDSGKFDSKLSTNQTYKNVKVQLLQCTDLSTASPIAGEELLPLEKYITGVVYAELGGTKNLEAQKALAVAARTYLFHRSIKEVGSDSVVMKIRNCTKDQVYCDPDQGCWSDDKTAGDTVHSGSDGNTHPYIKPAISSDSQIRKASLETVGEILVDKDGDIVKVGYNSTTQYAWMDSTSDYRSMLMTTYANGYDLYSNCVALGGTNGSGTQIGPITGKSSCTTFFDINSDYWGWTGKYNRFVGFGIQCTWYALGRTLQILHEDFNMPLDTASNLVSRAFIGNAGQWWENNLDSGTFSTSVYGDVDGARPGAVVVWGDRCGKQYGHVGVVESVIRDETGKVVEATFSEGNWKDNNGNKIPCVISTKGRQQILTQNKVDNGCRYLKGFIYLTSG